MERKREATSARELYKVIWILGGVFALFVLSFPIAILRVSQMEKFGGSHVKSFPLKGNLQHIKDQSPYHSTGEKK